MIGSFFNENCISFNIANSSSFGHMIDKSLEFPKKNPLQSYRTFSQKRRSFSFDYEVHQMTISVCVTRWIEQAGLHQLKHS